MLLQLYDNPLRFEMSDCGVISTYDVTKLRRFVCSTLNIFKTLYYSLNAAGDELKNTVVLFQRDKRLTGNKKYSTLTCNKLLKV